MSDSPSTGYQVLARKYRPATFADMIGQGTMVRTLRNAFEADRIAQAFVMTGIRGIGKTTTARIIAKGMNCIGTDGKGGPTTEPCGTCPNCVEIAEGNHIDVMEIDAASNTGVQNVRDVIIETVAYAPSKARFKVFIIDEVHMLSGAAFNALLKTLEEPPAHVKFILATTEIRKVPVTILSRCQRFDLRRIEPEEMIAYLKDIATRENAQVADDALALITRAAEGSVRDAMSLLDQAIAHGAGETTADQVRAMLGLADRARVMDLFDHVMRGDAAAALAELGAQYADGADPLAVLRDLAELTHWISVIKITPDAAEDPTVAPEERTRGRQLADALPMRVMTRAWQMLLKAIEETSSAPNTMMAAEMAIIRLTHVADLPSPEDLVRKLQETPPTPPTGGGGGSGGIRNTAPASQPATQPAPAPAGGGAQAALAPARMADTALARYPDFDSVLNLIRANRDQRLLIMVEDYVQLAGYRPGRIEFVPAEGAPANLAQDLGRKLQLWTGTRWAVSVVNKGGAPTQRQLREADDRALREEAEAHPLVQAVLEVFPQAVIREITPRTALEAEAAQEALPEVSEEWDPFEED